MKITILHKISFFILSTIFLISCSNKDNINYTPKVYLQPSNLAVTIPAATDNSITVNFNAVKDGVVYYSVQRSDVPAPTAESLIRENSSGTLTNSKADLVAGVDVSSSITNGVYGAYTYDVYAVMTSLDGIAGNIIKTSVTTPDTVAPVFLPSSSNPAFQSAGISPFDAVTFDFTEPVFYQGGDITFTGFNSGRVITFNNPAEISMSGTTLTVNSHGTFAEDDFIIITWANGTFKDNSGKPVAALTGFGHYFHTRLFTLPETAFLMQGTWNYSTVFYGGLGGFYAANTSIFLPDVGQIDLVLDPSDPDGLTLLGVNIFSPLNQISGFEQEPDNLKIKLGLSGTLDVVPNQLSGIPSAGGGTPFEWGPWSFFGTDFPGLYDLNGGTINHWLTLYVASSGAAVDDVDYNYSRVGTFAKPSVDAIKNLEKKNNLINKKIQQNQSYEKIEIGF